MKKFIAILLLASSLFIAALAGYYFAIYTAAPYAEGGEQYIDFGIAGVHSYD